MSFDQSKRSLSTCLCDSQPKLGGLFLIYIFMINDSVYLYISYIYISYMCLYDIKNDRSQYTVAVCQCPTVQVVHAEALRPRMLFSSLPIGTPLNSQSYET